MPIFRIIAENSAGTGGEQPLIEADSPEDAVAQYKAWPRHMNILSIELVQRPVSGV